MIHSGLVRLENNSIIDCIKNKNEYLSLKVCVSSYGINRSQTGRPGMISFYMVFGLVDNDRAYSYDLYMAWNHFAGSFAVGHDFVPHIPTSYQVLLCRATHRGRRGNNRFQYCFFRSLVM